MKKTIILLSILMIIIILITLFWLKRLHTFSSTIPASYYNIITFKGSAEPMSAGLQVDVILKGGWDSSCPVSLTQLDSVTYSYWGFDNLPHIQQGYLVINRQLASQVVAIFRVLYQNRF